MDESRNLFMGKGKIGDLAEERNHQCKSNVLLLPQKVKSRLDSAIECHDRPGGLLRFYHRMAA